MEKVHNLHQIFFCFVFTGYIIEFDAGLTGNIDLGVAFAELHGVAHGAAAHFVHQHPAHQLADEDKHDDRQNEGQQEAENRVHLRCLHLVELTTGSIEPVHQVWIVEGGSAVEARRLILGGEVNGVLLHLGYCHFLVIQHGEEGAVGYGSDLLPHDPGEKEGVEQYQYHQNHQVVKDQGLFGLLHFLHGRYLLKISCLLKL